MTTWTVVVRVHGKDSLVAEVLRDDEGLHSMYAVAPQRIVFGAQASRSWKMLEKAVVFYTLKPAAR
jgi:hypothetical protein